MSLICLLFQTSIYFIYRNAISSPFFLCRALIIFSNITKPYTREKRQNKVSVLPPPESDQTDSLFHHTHPLLP